MRWAEMQLAGVGCSCTDLQREEVSWAGRRRGLGFLLAPLPLPLLLPFLLRLLRRVCSCSLLGSSRCHAWSDRQRGLN